MLAATLFCCAIAIFSANANINDAIAIAAITQNNGFDDISCQNPAAFKKTVFFDQVSAGNGQFGGIYGVNNQIDAIAAAIAQEKIIGANNINDIIVANLISNKFAKNSAKILNQVIASNLGQDYSAAVVQNVLANDVIDIVSNNNPIFKKQAIIKKVNDISAINQISQIINAQQDISIGAAFGGIHGISGINGINAISGINGINGINGISNIFGQQRDCQNNVDCQIKTQAITQAVTQNICSNNLGNKIVEAKIACNAGAIVGKTIGQQQQYSRICQVAAQKFQQQSQQCVSDSCISKDAFEACCKNEQNIAKNIIAASIIN